MIMSGNNIAFHCYCGESDQILKFVIPPIFNTAAFTTKQNNFSGFGHGVKQAVAC